MLRADLSKATSPAPTSRTPTPERELHGRQARGANLTGAEDRRRHPDRRRLAGHSRPSGSTTAATATARGASLAAPSAGILSGQGARRARPAGRGRRSATSARATCCATPRSSSARASVEIESRFEQCSIALGRGAELTIGKSGVLARCRIAGAGNITIHGQFFERESPGIVGLSQLVVTSGGSLVGAVEQPPELTRFAFEPGCVLRMKILRAGQEQETATSDTERMGASKWRGSKRRGDERRRPEADPRRGGHAVQGLAHVRLPDRGARAGSRAT